MILGLSTLKKKKKIIAFIEYKSYKERTQELIITRTLYCFGFR